MSVTISPLNCEYRAEGNAGIVIRLIKEDKVLRLIKQDVSEPSPHMENVRKELEDQIKMIENILKPLLGRSFVHCPIIVLLKAEEIRMLNKTVSEFRPVHRRYKSAKEEDACVLMLPDYCSLPQSLNLLSSQGPVLCIEIKPKQGFVKEETLPTGLNPLPVSMCRFCMMQKYKLKKGSISSQSGYCPTDLFSGNGKPIAVEVYCQYLKIKRRFFMFLFSHARMFHALKMLCKTPQNNFRIFKDRKLIYSEEEKNDLNSPLSDFFENSETIRNTDLLCNLIIQALLKPFPDGMHQCPVSSQKISSKICKNAFSDSSENDASDALPPSCILERILNCQLLDDLHIADLFELYLKVKENDNKSSDYIGCYLRSEFPPHVGELQRNSNETEYQYVSRKVWEFLLGLTMKDCSIMLVLRRLVNSSDVLQTQNVICGKDENRYIFSIALADLDSKALHKVEKVHNYMSFLLNL